MENFQTRQALQEAFFGFESDLKWYRRRLGGEIAGGKETLQTLCSIWVRLLAPIIPFTSEELWAEMGQQGLVSFAPWPEVNENLVHESAEIAEELLQRTVEDIESILRIIHIKPGKVTICVSPDWKYDIFRMVATAQDKKNVIREIMQHEEVRSRGKEAADAVRQCTTHYHRLSSTLVDRIINNRPDEFNVFSQAKAFLEKDLVHLKGQPARSTRRVLNRLAKEFELPVAVFTDGDPWSYRIYASVAYGSIKSAHISEILATPSARFIGVQPTDIRDYDLPSDKLSEQDISALKSELTDPRFATDYWHEQINLQLSLNLKSEQQAFAARGLDFVTDEYLPARLSEMGII